MPKVIVVMSRFLQGRHEVNISARSIISQPLREREQFAKVDPSQKRRDWTLLWKNNNNKSGAHLSRDPSQSGLALPPLEETLEECGGAGLLSGECEEGERGGSKPVSTPITVDQPTSGSESSATICAESVSSGELTEKRDSTVSGASRVGSISDSGHCIEEEGESYTSSSSGTQRSLSFPSSNPRGSVR